MRKFFLSLPLFITMACGLENQSPVASITQSTYKDPNPDPLTFTTFYDWCKTAERPDANQILTQEQRGTIFLVRDGVDGWATCEGVSLKLKERTMLRLDDVVFDFSPVIPLRKYLTVIDVGLGIQIPESGWQQLAQMRQSKTGEYESRFTCVLIDTGMACPSALKGSRTKKPINCATTNYWNQPSERIDPFKC